MKGISTGVKKVQKFGGTDIEKRVAQWLENRGFSKIKKFEKRHAGCYDITANKGKDRWVIEVKGGYTKYNPSVSIDNLIRMTKEHGFNKIGLIFLPRNKIPMFFELNRQSYKGLKASKTKGKKKEREARRKAWRTRRKNKKR